MKFYAVVNDLIGGFAVAVKDSPVSELDNRTYHQIICETITMEDAELIARLLNEEWDRGWRWELNREGL